MNYGHKQDPVIDKDNGFAAYISSFEDDVKLPIVNHSFVQEHHKKFQVEITKYKRCHCMSCQEGWPINYNINCDLTLFMFDQCVRDNSEPKRFSDDNDMIPLNLVSGLVAETRYFMDTRRL